MMFFRVFFRRLYLSSLCGRWSTARLHLYLNYLAFQHYVGSGATTNKATRWEQAFWMLPETQEYWRDWMPHLWACSQANSGTRIRFENLTRGQAIDALMTSAPRSTILFIDDNRSFIFYKPSET